MSRHPFYYLLLNHWTQGGIGYSFPGGWYDGKKYNRNFSTIYTIHKMLDAADEYPGLKVSMELDAFAYEEVLKEAPDCIDRLKEYIREGKAGVDGGTYGQPFGQDFGWEPNIRQLTYGRKSIYDILEYDVKAFLVEEQWFHPQMPQLLVKSGFHYASLQNQNSGQVMPMNESIINWVGVDGSKIPTIPANDLMVSCVRQYTDYSVYKEIIDTFDHPLLLQWVEIWAPGMDWGSSCKPFEKAILQALEWGAKPVALTDYFELELPNRKELKDIFIPLDEANYVNNWYQSGGWGFEGDKVIMLDKLAERSLLTFETLATLNTLKFGANYPNEELTSAWKKLMILQNHDFSGARQYRATTEEGITTTFGSLALSQYNRLKDKCNLGTEKILSNLTNSLQSNDSFDSFVVFNPLGNALKHTVAIEIPGSSSDEFTLMTEKGEHVPFQITQRENNKIKGYATLELPALGTKTIRKVNESRIRQGEKVQTSVKTGGTWIEDESVRIEWVPNTWKINIVDKKQSNTMTFTGFSGPISKVNEHDGNVYPALSPGHEVFSFAFDGKTNSPDQVSKVTATVENVGEVRSTLLLRSNLLTLHTTETPVAFAEARVSIDHQTGKVECESYFFTGVYLSLQCWAEFKHQVTDMEYYRDYPFGEEKTNISTIFANTYLRGDSKDYGFTLIHPGVQRVQIINEKNISGVKHLLARDRVLGEYNWKFSLYLGKHKPWESAVLSQIESVNTPVIPGKVEIESFIAISDQRVILSACYQESNKTIVRMVNYSSEEINHVKLAFPHHFTNAVETDFNGNHLSGIHINTSEHDTQFYVQFKPWEIKTFALT